MAPTIRLAVSGAYLLCKRGSRKPRQPGSSVKGPLIKVVLRNIRGSVYQPAKSAAVGVGAPKRAAR